MRDDKANADGCASGLHGPRSRPSKLAVAEKERGLAQKVLRDRENIYKFLLDSSKEIILILSKAAKVLFANKTALQIFGYSEEEIIGKSIAHFLTKDSIRKSLFALAQEFLGHPQPEMEIRAKTKSGEIRYLRIAEDSAPVYDEGKLIGLMVCGSDITALRKTELELTEKEERFRELWDNAPVAYHTVDINGIITDVNQTELRMLGYAKEEMLGRSIFDFVLPEQRAEAQRRFRQKISSQKISRAESRIYLKKDGSKTYVAIDDVLERDRRGKIVGVRTTMVDITERKLAEDALRESEEKYRTLAENVNLGIYRNTVGPKGRFLEANPAIIKMFGYESKEEFLVVDVSDLYQNSEDRMKFNEKMLREGLVKDEELQLKKKDGTPFIGSISAVAVKDEQGHIKYYDGIIEDITEHRLAEKALEESEQKFRNLAEQSPNMIFINKNGRIVYANEKCQEIMGYTRAEFYSPDFDFLILIAPEHREKIKRNFSQHGQGEEIPPYEYSIVTKEGKIIEAIMTTKLIEYGGGKAILGTITDITERKKSEKLKNSIYRISEAAHSAENLEELFRSIHEIIGELMPAKNFYLALYDSDWDMLSFPYFADEYDISPSPKKPGKGLTEYVLRSGETLLASPEVFSELVKKGEVELIGAPSIDWLGVPLKTENKTFGVMVVQSYTQGVRFSEEDKEILKFVSGQTAMAIKRKHAEKQIKDSLREKEALLQEIHHRVKNNLQIISSLLNLQTRQIMDQDFIKMVKNSQSRIRSMALVHEKLYGSRDFSNINFSDYIRSLATQLFQFHQVDPNLVKLKMNLEDVFLNIQTAIPCGLILNELITNSLKHAFPDGRGGEILVELHPCGEQTYQIIVQDNGVGIPGNLDLKQTASMGLQIVTILVNQLDGTLEMHRDCGTAAKILFKELRYKPRL